MNTNELLRFATVSDIHLGHTRNKTASVITNLNKHLSNDRFMSTIDVLFIAGDVFDELLDLSNPELTKIDLWICKLLLLAIKHDVQIYVLEGTPSHDRGQSIRFTTINAMVTKSGSKPAKLTYVNALDILTLPKFNLTVLFVPDEWGSSAEDALDQVKQLMYQKGLTQVDLGIMHGLFPHQLDIDIPHLSRHDDLAYSALVKYTINIGHIHAFSQHLNIIAQGSFDRLSHNEEEPKGFVRTVLHKDGTYTATFVENTTAATFKTINCYHDSVTENLLLIDSETKNLRTGSYCRIEAHYQNPILANMSVIKERWPCFVWSEIKRGKEKKKVKTVVDHKNVYIPIVLDRANLPNQLLDRVHRLEIPYTIKDQCCLLMAEISEGI